jgi:rhamnosyltransferase
MPIAEEINRAEYAARPIVSVIVRAKNEEALLGETLRLLHAQSFRAAEILLIDSGSTDRTLEIARGFPGVRVIEIPPEDFTFGRALNIGCTHSTGEILVFISAHALPGTDQWMARLLKYFDDSRVVGVWGGQRRRPGAGHAPRVVYQDLAMFRRNIYFGFNNSNCALRKSVWEKYPFHEGMPGSEDKEWAHRVLSDGHVLVHDSEAFVYHRHDDSIRQAWWRAHREQIGLAQFAPDHRVKLTENFWYAYYALIVAWGGTKGLPGRGRLFARKAAGILATTVGRYTGNHRWLR